MVVRFIFLSLIVAVLSYALGHSHAQTQETAKQIEIIKYVHTKTSKIHAAPHAGRDILLELMRNKKL